MHSMKLFNRKNNTAAAIPEDLQPYYNNQPSGAKRWIGPILRIVLLIAALALLIFGAIWLVRHFTGNDDAKKTSAQTSSQNISDPATDKKSDNKSGSAGKTDTNKAGDTNKGATGTNPAPAAQPNAPQPAPSTPAAPDPAAGSDTLVNTGPGETLALFVLVAVLAGFAHRLYTLRKLN